MSHRLLVIDDSLTIRKLVEISFRDTGLAMDFASSGREGVRKAKASPPTLILLDYVLPDMKGVDVCARLAESEETANLPIVLMTAKGAEIREQFRPYGSVLDFISKPFGAADIKERIQAILSQGERVEGRVTAPPSRPTFTFDQKERIAAVIFGQLRSRLSLIPEWMAELQGHPSRYFARKILTPEVIESMLLALLPEFQRLAASSPTAEQQDGLLVGKIGILSLYELLRMVAGVGRPTVLELSESKTQIYLHQGQIALVTTTDPARYTTSDLLDLSAVPEDALQRAQEEQRRSGKPLYVSLAEEGQLPRCDLSAVLFERSKRLLLWVFGREMAGGSFVLRDLPSEPMYVEAYGRGLSMRQLTLELMRLNPKSVGEPPPAPLDEIYERGLDFRAKVSSLELVSIERRVLTLIDGKTTGYAVAERSGLPAQGAQQALQRLLVLELIRKKEILPAQQGPLARHPVMIHERDEEGVQQPLRRLLQARHDPFELVSLEAESDLFATIKAREPSLVLLNVDQATERSLDVIRAIKAAPATASIPVVAILEMTSSRPPEELIAAGFDSVMTKPLNYTAIERWLVA